MNNPTNNSTNNTTPTPIPFTANYAPTLTIARGRGAYVWDSTNTKYLDFASGIAVNALGNAPRALAWRAWAQMKKAVHTSNLFAAKPTYQIANDILAYQPFDKQFTAIFFGNSGAEANEAALKFATFYQESRHTSYKPQFACFEGGFHGRTIGALSVTPQPKYQRSLAHFTTPPLVLKYNHLPSLRKLHSGITAVIIEVVQGEGGLRAIDNGFAQALNHACRRHNIVLIADEIQTALGRCGTIYASEQVGLEPDIITLSKPLGGGLPLSATLVTADINSALSLGVHGSTFGGNPVAAAAGRWVWHTVTQNRFLAQVQRQSHYLAECLHRLKKNTTLINEIRGKGMLRGLVCSGVPVAQLVAGALDKGLIVLRSGEDVLRLAPPLNVTKAHINHACTILAQVFQQSTP